MTPNMQRVDLHMPTDHHDYQCFGDNLHCYLLLGQILKLALYIKEYSVRQEKSQARVAHLDV